MSAPHQCTNCYRSFSDKYLVYLETMKEWKDLSKEEMAKREQELIKSLVTKPCCIQRMLCIIRRPKQMVPR